MKKLFNAFGLTVFRHNPKLEHERDEYLRLSKIYKNDFRSYTMIPELMYIDNLRLAEKIKPIEGDIVECGVWKGGMIAGIARVLGNNRTYHLFDSFEGLPQAKENDGKAAMEWQQKKEDKNYFDNCRADEQYAEEAMKKSGCLQYFLHKGWFHSTLPEYKNQRIALLRLDGDWYESTRICLEQLYPQVADNGIIIIDDYHFWDGCTKAVHEYLYKNNLSDRICTTENGVAYIIKNQTINRFSQS